MQSKYASMISKTVIRGMRFITSLAVERSAPYYKIEIARQPTNAEPELSNRRRDRLVVARRNAAKML
jgi:hypothetical protein